MKTQKIVAPEGYEIDREKSTIDEIVFKEIKKALPKSWEEFEESERPGYVFAALYTMLKSQKASIALAKLEQLRDVYRDGWIPDWGNASWKYSIVIVESDLIITDYLWNDCFLSFPTKEIAQEFLNNFRDLIEQAKPLMS